MRHSWKYVFCVWLICVAGKSISGQPVPYGRYTGPRSLGIYSHGRAITSKSFLAPFGTVPTRRDVYCIADKDDGLYLHASVDAEHDRAHVNSVFLSSFPNCMHLPLVSARIDPAIWKTPEGIGIGSTRGAVLKAYGRPVFRAGPSKRSYEIAGIRDSDHIEIDSTDSYVYSCMVDEKHGCDDLRTAQFGFRHGKVIWILIADSE